MGYNIRFFLLFICTINICACQNYPFELREPRRENVQKIEQIVLTARPTDILFVIDNSGSMMEERALVRENVANFLDELTQSATDFQVGLITTDVECNLPTLDCSSAGLSSADCCLDKSRTLFSTSGYKCEDRDTNDDGTFDYTNCDGGRLRSSDGTNRIFTRPSTAERQDWIDRFSNAIAILDCDPANNRAQGSGYEAGLEAMWRAISCSVGADECPDHNVAQLNAGFIRQDADLVIIFITDEDDCSFDTSTRAANDPLYYRQSDLSRAANPDYQADHLCSASECYSYYFKGFPDNYTYRCGLTDRSVAPPEPTAVSTYLDKLIALKGDASRIRAAAIISGMPDSSDSLAGFNDAACYTGIGGAPSLDCSCLATSPSQLYCDLTGGERHPGVAEILKVPQCVGDLATEVTFDLQGGCQSLPGTRYSQFMRDLSERHINAGKASDVFIDSICQAHYDNTLYNIVNNIIIKNCFLLNITPTSVSDISVSLNGNKLANVEVKSRTPGWSWVEGSQEICLEGGLKKTVNDRFEIYILSP
ncbi:MAG: VWA domain-containing protein [Deltaproteobacteria bacterium]|nr:VWA domain-containing protein [Deltaproteobacteria bacterium]